jgi:hypothetical protein
MLVDALAHAVDPAKAKRRINRLRPTHAAALRSALEVADNELRFGGAVFSQPGREGISGLKESRHTPLLHHPMICHCSGDSPRDCATGIGCASAILAAYWDGSRHEKN